jgi:hypothetical protein
MPHKAPQGTTLKAPQGPAMSHTQGPKRHHTQGHTRPHNVPHSRPHKAPHSRPHNAPQGPTRPHTRCAINESDRVKKQIFPKLYKLYLFRFTEYNSHIQINPPPRPKAQSIAVNIVPVVYSPCLTEVPFQMAFLASHLTRTLYRLYTSEFCLLKCKTLYLVCLFSVVFSTNITNVHFNLQHN